MARRHDKRAIIVLAILAISSAGCFQIRYPEPGRPVAVAEGKSLAFGRIAVIDRDHEIEPWRSELREALFAGEKPEIRLSLFFVESDRRAIYVRIEPDGSFFWVLPAGTYLLYHSLVDRQLPNETIAAFQVPSGAHAVYLGAMTMRIESGRNRETGKLDYDVTAISIGSEFERAKHVLAARYPGLAGPIVQKLMITDPSLEGLFRDYSQKECERILDRHGLRLLDQAAKRKN